MKCLILAGGSGDRLWPLSRKNFPKQFIKDSENLSLFQEAVVRNMPFCDEFLIITNHKYEDIVLGQMKQFQGLSYRIILEKSSIGTAEAIAVVTNIYPDDTQVLIVPSDKIIGRERYSEAIYKAKELAANDKICLLGVRPNEPSVDYGYISGTDNQVEQFIEKPSAEIANGIFNLTSTLWNSGVFISKVSTLKEEYLKHASIQLKNAVDDYNNRTVTPSGSYLLPRRDSQNNSFEKAILEQSKNLLYCELHSKWKYLKDLNNYEDIFGYSDNNVIMKNTKNSTVINQAEGKLVVLNDLADIMVVNTADALYLSNKSTVDSIKEIASERDKDNQYFGESALIYRPWGTREIIQNTNQYRVRKIVIYPGMNLSSHFHENRNEIYTVISGVLTIIFPDKEVNISSGNSYTVEAGVEHRLSNKTDEDIVTLEVDVGSHIDEDDLIQGKNSYLRLEEMPYIYKLSPIYKDYLWGGSRLKDKYKKNSPYEITAESWELSTHPDGSSFIADGQFQGMSFDKFIEAYGNRLCGWKSKTFDRFPVLIKFIDAKKPLSIQIHPNDDYAFTVENEFGKNEMWYIVEADDGAFVYCGLSKDCSKNELEERIKNNTITEVLNKVFVRAGDVLFIPAGTIHAIGAGIFVCEIQQNSNSTYRIYDYDRIDANGNKRDLNIEKAMDVAIFNSQKPQLNSIQSINRTEDNNRERLIASCKYFQVVHYDIDSHEIIPMDESSFKSIIVLEGNCEIKVGDERTTASPGESIFIAAGRKRIHIDGECELIVTNI